MKKADVNSPHFVPARLARAGLAHQHFNFGQQIQTCPSNRLPSNATFGLPEAFGHSLPLFRPGK